MTIDYETELYNLRNGTDACDHGIDPDRSNEYLDLIGREYPGKHNCVIADQVWNEIRFLEHELDEPYERGRKPYFLYSRKIINDSEERGFSSVLTTLQVGFSYNAVFESENRIYLLVGPGCRNYVSFEAYINFSSPYQITEPFSEWVDQALN